MTAAIPSVSAPCPGRTVAASRSMQRALEDARRIGQLGIPVLISGETGTGKEIIARTIHQARGPRRPYMDVNCAAMPNEMVDGLLFGYQRGAYTGALVDTQGFVEAASDGVLYLDELCSLPLPSQAKLLRLLENGTFRRLGEVGVRHMACQVVASVQEPAASLALAGRLRSDLYHRMAVGLIELRPLRDRPDDLLSLARQFASDAGHSLTDEAMTLLQAYAWPGNVRELRACITRAILRSDGARIAASDISRSLPFHQPGAGRTRAGAERRQLLEIAASCAWDMRRVATRMQVSVSTAYRRFRELGLRPREARRLFHRAGWPDAPTDSAG